MKNKFVIIFIQIDSFYEYDIIKIHLKYILNMNDIIRFNK